MKLIKLTHVSHPQSMLSHAPLKSHPMEVAAGQDGATALQAGHSARLHPKKKSHPNGQQSPPIWDSLLRVQPLNKILHKCLLRR